MFKSILFKRNGGFKIITYYKLYSLLQNKNADEAKNCEKNSESVALMATVVEALSPLTWS